MSAKQVAKQIRDEFYLDLIVGTADNLEENFEDAIRRGLEWGRNIDTQHQRLKDAVVEAAKALPNRLEAIDKDKSLETDEAKVAKFLEDLAPLADATRALIQFESKEG